MDKRKPPGTLPPPGDPPIRLSPLQASPVRASPPEWFEAPLAIRNDLGTLGYIPLEIRISEKDNEKPSGVTMRGRLWRSVPRWWLIPTLLCTLLVGGCSVPDSMGVRSGADPRHQDDNVGFARPTTSGCSTCAVTPPAGRCRVAPPGSTPSIDSA